MSPMQSILFVFALSTPIPLESEKVEVNGRRYSWLDTVQTASEGSVDQEQLKERPLLRPGEIMEAVPGMIASQHSGTGKANQYFLRGFNLDHGTDFATSVDGVPINMPSHAHGQGYTDVNFLVPELLEKLDYGKGPYSVTQGDFSGAGHLEMKTVDAFSHGLVKYTGGSHGYHRLLALDSWALADDASLSLAYEGTRYVGPWSDVDEDLQKNLGWIKSVFPTAAGQHSLTFQHYAGQWNSADQIPARAVQDGRLDRLGSVDPSTGGRTRRGSVNWIWNQQWDDSSLRWQLYGVDYDLNLWSNPTYFLDEPEYGDQFEQEDRRFIFGGSAVYSQTLAMGSVPGRLLLGLQNRNDSIRKVGLYRTTKRERRNTVSEFAVGVHQLGLFVRQEWNWTPRLHSSLGLRHDHMQWRARDRALDEERHEQDQITSPKFTAAYRILPTWQVFASAGQSFHSNDARGVTARDNPAPGLVPVRGYELGSRFDFHRSLRCSLALWRLQLDSELIYIGDAGTTEASRASQREGLDTLLQFAPSSAFYADLELSWARARFRSDADGEGSHVEGHLPFVAMLGLGSQLSPAWSASARLRHFGARPLTADRRQESQPTSLVNLHLAYAHDDWELTVDGLNVLNSKAHDIDYYYASRLPDEDESVEDLHYHPVEPVSLRFSLGRRL